MKLEAVSPKQLVQFALADAIKHIREADACLMAIRDALYQEADR